MSSAQITYNSKTITFAGQGGSGTSGAPAEWIIDPHLARSINKTLTGVIETIYRPRIDVRVSISFPERRGSTATPSEAFRVQLENWWQWAIQGNQFRFQLDSTKSVKTTLSGAEAAGQTVLSVTSVTGIVAGQYVVVGGPNYQTVNVVSVGASDVTISPSLDFSFATGSTFRDRYLWDAKLIDSDASTPITDVNLNSTDPRFRLAFSFIETP